MKYSLVAVVVFYASFTGKMKAVSEEVDLIPSVEYKGRCAYPCAMQNHVIQKIGGTPGIVGVRNSTDPTILTVLRNDTVLAVIECIMRSGPFVMTRQQMEGNTTHARYRCSKYVFDDDNGDIMTVYRTPLGVFKNYPSICEVCNGEGMETPNVLQDTKQDDCRVVIVPDMGCNIPVVCPVTNPDVQVQCTCADEIFDSGFCCP